MTLILKSRAVMTNISIIYDTDDFFATYHKRSLILYSNSEEK